MEIEIAQQFGMGLLVLFVGICGWILPPKWNFLRFRPTVASLLPDHINRVVPKVFGSVLILGGLTIIIGTFPVGRFD